MLLIQAVGDVAPRRPDPAAMFAGVADVLGRGDLLFGQMECPLSTRGTPAPNAKLAMRTDPAVAPVLRDLGFDVMSIAGNHALDFGAVALADTLDAFRASGIAPCGAGPTIADARAPALLEAAGRRVAFIAYSSVLPAGYAADTARPGCAPMAAYTHYHQVEPDQPGTPPRILTFADSRQLDALVADIRRAKDRADIVAVSMHWGIHFVRAEVADYQREVAHVAIEAGADMIIGHHPHLLKGIGFHRGKPILYSLGNFAIEQPSAFSKDVALDRSFAELQRLNPNFAPGADYMNPPETRHTLIAQLAIADDGSIELTALPCWIADGSEPMLLQPGDDRRHALVDYVGAITAEAGLNSTVEDTGRELRFRPLQECA